MGDHAVYGDLFCHSLASLGFRSEALTHSQKYALPNGVTLGSIPRGEPRVRVKPELKGRLRYETSFLILQTPPIHSSIKLRINMTTYKVEKHEGNNAHGYSYYVIGLEEEFGGQPDTLLIYCDAYLESETPDVDTHITSAEMMFNALYDLFQCHDGIHDGDTFETEFGRFGCEGVHVLPLLSF
jgi:hypothetical protein